MLLFALVYLRSHLIQYYSIILRSQPVTWGNFLLKYYNWSSSLCFLMFLIPRPQKAVKMANIYELISSSENFTFPRSLTFRLCVENRWFFIWRRIINYYIIITENEKVKQRSMHYWKDIFISEAVSRRCSVKKVFLEILQNSQEKTCTRDSFSISCRPKARSLVE